MTAVEGGAIHDDDRTNNGHDPRSVAVEESRALLRRHWAAWQQNRGFGGEDGPPVTDPVTQPPVVYQVGIEPDRLQWVALIRFEVDVAGQRWHGMVRGPVDDPVLRVMPGASPDTGQAAEVRRRRRRWRGRWPRN